MSDWSERGRIDATERRREERPTVDAWTRVEAALTADAEAARRPVPAGLVERIQGRLAEEPIRPGHPRRPWRQVVWRSAAAAALVAIALAVWPEAPPQAPARATRNVLAELAGVETAVRALPGRWTANLTEPLSTEAERLAEAGTRAARRFRIPGPLRALVPFVGAR